MYYIDDDGFCSWFIENHRTYVDAMKAVVKFSRSCPDRSVLHRRIYRVSIDADTGDPVFTYYPLGWEHLMEAVKLENEMDEEVSMALLQLDPDINLGRFHASPPYFPPERLPYYRAIVALARGELEPPPEPYELCTFGELC